MLRSPAATQMLKNGSVVLHDNYPVDMRWEAIWRVRGADGRVIVTWAFFCTKDEAVAHVEAQTYCEAI